MLDKTSLDDKKILVLFNIEFLQVLVEERKINPENIYYIADNDLEYLSAIKIFKVQSYKLNDFSVPALKKLIAGIDMKFDLVFSNPPYNTGKTSNTDLDILNTVCDFSNEIIFIHPCNWLYDLLMRKNFVKELKQKINYHIRSIEIYPVNSFDGIQLANKLDVIHIDTKYNGNLIFKDLNKPEYYLESIYDVSPVSDVLSLSKPFYDSIEKYIIDNDCLYSHTCDVSHLPVNTLHNDGFWYCQLADVIGQPDRPEYYGFLLKDYLKNYGLRKTGRDENGNPITKILSDGSISNEGAMINSFKFLTEFEMKNFINYCRTDFARFCLVKVKKDKCLHRGALKSVPWLDFTEEWDDDKLFKKFDVSQELQDYIRDFLPDYYSIRK